MSTADPALVKELAALTKRQNLFEDRILAGDLAPDILQYCMGASERYAGEVQKVRAALLGQGGGLGDETSVKADRD